MPKNKEALHFGCKLLFIVINKTIAFHRNFVKINRNLLRIQEESFITKDQSRVIAAITEAVLNESDWTTALDKISQHLGIAGATLVPLKGNLRLLPTSTEFSEAIAAYQEQLWFARDVRFNAMNAMLSRGIGTDQDFITGDEMDRHPYYQEWLRPFGLRWFAGVHIKGFEEEWVLSLQKPIGSEPFSQQDFPELLSLSQNMAHLANVYRVFETGRNRSALEAFNASRKAAVLVSRLGSVVGANREAERILSGQDIFVRARKLACKEPASNTNLANAIDAISSGRTNTSSNVVIRRQNNLPLIATVIPASDAIRNVLQSCHSFIVLSDPGHRQEQSAALIQETLSLSMTESHICAKLAAGAKLRDISMELGLSYETVRTYLRRIFQKTGLNNQVDLVALLVQLWLQN